LLTYSPLAQRSQTVSLSVSTTKNWSPKTFLLFQLYFGRFGSTALAAGLVGAGFLLLQPLNATKPASNMLANMIIIPALPFIFCSFKAILLLN
jgi:hypothetical protein